jgi:hypothetical protein
MAKKTQVKTYRVLHEGMKVGNSVRQVGDLMPEAASFSNLNSYIAARHLEVAFVNQDEIDEFYEELEKREAERAAEEAEFESESEDEETGDEEEATPETKTEPKKRVAAKKTTKKTAKKTVKKKVAKKNGLAEQSV